jgi:hypothetical protein
VRLTFVGASDFRVLVIWIHFFQEEHEEKARVDANMVVAYLDEYLS